MAVHTRQGDRARAYGFLDLWSRFHYKSTLGTFAGILQEIICDPEVTIAIMSCTSEVATPFLVQLQQEMETNEDLKETFPDVFWKNPRRESPRWSRDDGLVVKRKGNPKEATIEAFGIIDGMRTGKHYRKHYFDDLVTEKLVTSEEMVAKVTERYELADNPDPTRAPTSAIRHAIFVWGHLRCSPRAWHLEGAPLSGDRRRHAQGQAGVS